MANCYHCGPDGNASMHVCNSCREKFRNNVMRAYHEDYTGLRFRYGYINRPFAIVHQPKGFDLCSYLPDNKVEIKNQRARHGTIDYPFPLTDDEMYSFELFFVEVSRG